jgi:16S rRNA (guanine527-N7)-methyltransferase
MDGDRKKRIGDEFRKAGLTLTEGELSRFLLLDCLLREKRGELDLTRIDSERSIITKHYLDSAFAAEYIREESGIIMDLGSGAGFPGLPIAIRKPKLKLLLAEPRLKRLTFLDEAVELLKLENVELHPHKVGPGFDRHVDAVITRDFLPMRETLELCAAFLKTGASLYLMKGPKAPPELEEARKLKLLSGFGPPEVSSYSLNEGKISRTIIYIKKKEDIKNNNSIKNYINNIENNKIIQKRLNVTEIASRANSRFKGFLKLHQGRNIKKSGETLASGRKIVKEICLNHPGLIKGALVKNLSELDDFAFPPEVEIILLRPEIFPLIDVFGTGPPLLLLKTPEIGELDPFLPFKGPRLFVPFQDPVNVGSVVRTAAALGAGLVLLKEAANPFHPKALRVSGPTLFSAALLRGPSLSSLKDLNLPNLYALSARGRDIYRFEPESDSLNLAMGLEGPGLDEFFPPEKRLSIPMTPQAESLNATAAAAMALAVLGPKLRR